MKCLHLLFLAELEQAQTILIAGAGGGFDVFSGLPLYFGLRAAGKRVHLGDGGIDLLGRCATPAADADDQRGKRFHDATFPHGASLAAKTN